VNTSGVTGYTFVERTVDVKGDFIDGVLYADSISTDDDDDHHDEHDD
jgi:hypothetical protein